MLLPHLSTSSLVSCSHSAAFLLDSDLFYSNPGGPLDPVLTSIATAMSTRSSKNVVPSQVLLKFTEHLGAVVVTTSGKEWRMQEQLAAGGIPSLTAEEVESIESASKDHYKRVYMPHMQEI